MTSHITLNPLYENLRTFISELPQNFSHAGKVMYRERNEIRVVEKEGIQLNIKEFCIPVFPNRIIYHLFRPTKARRAYEYAFRLRKAGFNTPEPIAFVLTWHGGLLGKSYFVSRQVDYPRRFYEFGIEPLQGKEDIVRAFGAFTARLHNAGIFHKDYSPGNILFDLKNGHTEFCLVDINRMEFGPVSLEKGCKSFARLWGKETFFRIAAEAYAQGRHFSPEICTARILEYRHKFWSRYRRHRPVKFELDL